MKVKYIYQTKIFWNLFLGNFLGKTGLMKIGISQVKLSLTKNYQASAGDKFYFFLIRILINFCNSYIFFVNQNAELAPC